MKELNQYIDHTALKPTVVPEDILQLCKEAISYNFYAVCVNSCYVFLASNTLKQTPIRVVTTVGFPLGTSSTKAKVSEAKKAIKDGADEIDMVINIGFLKAGLLKSVREEISAVKKAVGRRTLKVIIETCYLSNSEKKIACEIAKKAGADFIKTSTGFGEGGASIQDIELIKSTIGNTTKIKASGGIKSKQEALAYIEAGADRIGTSNGVKLLHIIKDKQL